MGDGSIPMATGLGLKVVDSQELRKKQRESSKLQHNSKTVHTMQSGSPMTNISTPQSFSGLGHEVPDTPLEPQQSFKPSFVQSNVYPQRTKPGTYSSTNPSPQVSSSIPVANESQIPNSHGSPSPVFTTPTKSPNPLNPQNPNSQNPNPYSANPQSGIPSLNADDSHGLSPTQPGSSPSRKLQQVFQVAGARLDSTNRLTSLVNSIEGEMQKSGINVDFSKFKDHLIQLQESGPDMPSGFALEGDFVSVQDEQVPSHAEPEASDHPQVTKHIPRGGQTKNWSSLFKAQAPAKSMRLDHYPEFQKGKDAHVVFDESQLDDGVGKHCLVGHFLDGKMPIPLLTATARTVWKDHGKFSIKQLGSSYLFEFDDEASKLAVLEGGPYFFSRRYLVLKEWKRMLAPGKTHPSTIPVWIKLHKLPLEFWTHVGFSKVASAIGKPIYVDEATANKKRLDFARICVEIDAGDELPSDITISVNSDSVMVGVEYQWLPPRCETCKVFGHSCRPKAVPKQTNPVDEWKVVGKIKPTPTGLQVDNQEAASESQTELLNQESLATSPSALQTQSEKQNCLTPSLETASASNAASSSTHIESVTMKPTSPPPSHIPQPLPSHHNHVPPVLPAHMHPSDDDSLSEGVDEEFIIQDKELDQSPPHRTKSDASIVNSRGPRFQESNSAKKKRLKKERKLRNQGSI